MTIATLLKGRAAIIALSSVSWVEWVAVRRSAARPMSVPDA